MCWGYLGHQLRDVILNDVIDIYHVSSTKRATHNTMTLRVVIYIWWHSLPFEINNYNNHF